MLTGPNVIRGTGTSASYKKLTLRKKEDEVVEKSPGTKMSSKFGNAEENSNNVT
jgi:hypothetical protein